MKITSEIMRAEINQKLPPYYSCSPGAITTPPGLDGLWFSMAFTYPGLGKEKFVWVSVKEDMTSDEIDKWSTDAAIQIKTTQQIKELEDTAKELDSVYGTG
jgi:hypothetical protein